MATISVFKEIILLVKKDLALEWRQRFAIQSVLLYMGCAVFVCYLSIGIKGSRLIPNTWSALFWIILLFAAINAVTKSFLQEDKQRNLYYYTLVSPQALIISKIIYNSFLVSLLSFIGFALYVGIMGNPIQEMGQFAVCLLLGSFGFSSTFTLISAIASKAGNNSSLMAIMSIPLIIPLLLVLMKFAKNAIDGLPWISSYDEMIQLAALNILLGALSYILFPFLWRS